MMRYWQHGETGRLLAMENNPMGEWYEIEKDQYEEALHPLTPANTVLQADALPCGHQFANLRTDASEPYCNFCGKPVRR